MERQVLFNGAPFWSDSVNFFDGKIEEVHSYWEAQSADFHYTLYFSQAQIEKWRTASALFFWISEEGATEGEWRETLGDGLIRRILEQITFQEKTNQNRRNDMAANVYILSACDVWAGTDSMRILGVTTNETMLYTMLAAKIKAGDMEYDGSGEDAWRKFQRDFKNEEVNFNKLKFGFVQAHEAIPIWDWSATLFTSPWARLRLSYRKIRMDR